MTQNKPKKKQNFFYKLIGINLLELNIEHPDKNPPKDITYNFEIHLEYRFNLDKKIVFVVTTVSISDQNNREIQIGHITTSCNFEVKNLDNYIEKDKDKVNFPTKMLYELNSISISTTRGVMFSHFRGTHLHKAHLPIVDPKSFKETKKNNRI